MTTPLRFCLCTNNDWRQANKTYNIRGAPVVTYSNTSLMILPACVLESNGARMLQYLKSYVTDPELLLVYVVVYSEAS